VAGILLLTCCWTSLRHSSKCIPGSTASNTEALNNAPTSRTAVLFLNRKELQDVRYRACASGVSRAGFGLRVGFGPFKGCDDVSFVGECLLFGWGKFVVRVGGDGHG
jgi:hypothetical protein